MRIQLVAVGLDILRNAQASSSVRLCDSMVTPSFKELDDVFSRGDLSLLHESPRV